MYKYDKDKLKESLTIEQVHDLVAELGGHPQPIQNNMFLSQTICHNYPGEGSYKLYYYGNTKLFKCYTDCGDSFDIYQLVCKHKNIIKEAKSYHSREGELIEREWELFDAIEFVAVYFGFAEQSFEFPEAASKEEWEVLNNYTRLREQTLQKKIVEMKTYDDAILKHLPQPRIEPWIREGITQEVMNSRGIAFDPHMYGIVIPHFDIDGKLIGIRERTLVKENEKYGKYRPAILNGKMYNHPLGFNLYNLNYSKENIKTFKRVIVGEGEKFCLTYASYFGMENDITVACCGSSLINYQVEMLLSLGVEEIIIAFDKQFKVVGDNEWKNWIKKLYDIYHKYGGKVQISFLFDDKDLLGYKDSPIDCGKDTFIQLFEERIYIE